MRPINLALLAALTACGSEPPAPPPTPDAAPLDNPPPDVISLDAGPVDAPGDTGPLEDRAAMDVTAVDATRDAPSVETIPVADAPAPDASDVAQDAPTPDDVPPGECAMPERACATNADCAMCTPVRGMAWCCGRNVGRSFCMVPDSNGFCAGVTITPTVECATKSVARCRTHADCARCFPAASGEPWCCSASNGECGWSPGRTACR